MRQHLPITVHYIKLQTATPQPNPTNLNLKLGCVPPNVGYRQSLHPKDQYSDPKYWEQNQNTIINFLAFLVTKDGNVHDKFLRSRWLAAWWAHQTGPIRRGYLPHSCLFVKFQVACTDEPGIWSVAPAPLSMDPGSGRPTISYSSQECKEAPAPSISDTLSKMWLNSDISPYADPSPAYRETFSDPQLSVSTNYSYPSTPSPAQGMFMTVLGWWGGIWLCACIAVPALFAFCYFLGCESSLSGRGYRICFLFCRMVLCLW